MGWDTRSGALANINNSIDGAVANRDAITARIGYMATHASAGEWQEAFYDCFLAFNLVSSALNYLIGRKSGGPPDYGITFFLEEYTIAEAGDFELTWKDILLAWNAAPLPGIMWTVEHIDQMRQLVWDENPIMKWNVNPFE